MWRSLSFVMHPAVVSIDLFPRITPWQTASPLPSSKVTYSNKYSVTCHIYLHSCPVAFGLPAPWEVSRTSLLLALFIRLLLVVYPLRGYVGNRTKRSSYARDWSWTPQLRVLMIPTCHGQCPSEQTLSLSSFWFLFRLPGLSEEICRSPHGFGTMRIPRLAIMKVLLN